MIGGRGNMLSSRSWSKNHQNVQNHSSTKIFWSTHHRSICNISL